MLPPPVICFLINLDRSSQRLADMRARLTALAIDFTRIAAVDGASLDDAEFLRQTQKNRYYKPIRRGEVGCYLSHIKTLQSFLATSAPYALILEDDCEFHPGFLETFVSAISLRDSSQDPLLQWDVLKLNRRRRRYIALAPLAADHLLVEYGLSVPITTAAAVWTRHAAQVFVQAYSGTSRPIDCDLQHPWEYGLKILSVHPPLIQQGGVASTIGDRKHGSHNALSKLAYECKRLWPKLRQFGRSYGWSFIAGWLWRQKLRFRNWQ
ncbi:MAG TPA: glycosyltransferase family 25 protein [Thermomonas sp.]|jgi:glycosyl transferase family 25|nr:glycosyltransferase family 25 protein [Thermomonas sp.]HQY50641.1 glycosyltransferase family 25 protein [Thermomonas sp.]HRA57422.1 glycosyltransferase family 25 protein [Thermomonas sp.]